MGSPKGQRATRAAVSRRFLPAGIIGELQWAATARCPSMRATQAGRARCEAPEPSGYGAHETHEQRS